jgi:hypothetical protein
MSGYGFKRAVRLRKTPTSKGRFWSQEKPNSRREIIRKEVRRAVAKLDCHQREFVECFYFMGETYEQIQKRLGKERYKLERIHQQALERLRFLLADFVEAHFGFKVERANRCPICSHPKKEKIERILERKRPEESWRPIMKILRKEFGLESTAVQTVIAHLRKHMQ